MRFFSNEGLKWAVVLGVCITLLYCSDLNSTQSTDSASEPGGDHWVFVGDDAAPCRVIGSTPTPNVWQETAVGFTKEVADGEETADVTEHTVEVQFVVKNQKNIEHIENKELKIKQVLIPDGQPGAGGYEWKTTRIRWNKSDTLTGIFFVNGDFRLSYAYSQCHYEEEKALIVVQPSGDSAEGMPFLRGKLCDKTFFSNSHIGTDMRLLNPRLAYARNIQFTLNTSPSPVGVNLSFINSRVFETKISGQSSEPLEMRLSASSPLPNSIYDFSFSFSESSAHGTTIERASVLVDCEQNGWTNPTKKVNGGGTGSGGGSGAPRTGSGGSNT